MTDEIKPGDEVWVRGVARPSHRRSVLVDVEAPIGELRNVQLSVRRADIRKDAPAPPKPDGEPMVSRQELAFMLKAMVNMRAAAGVDYRHPMAGEWKRESEEAQRQYNGGIDRLQRGEDARGGEGRE